VSGVISLNTPGGGGAGGGASSIKHPFEFPFTGQLRSGGPKIKLGFSNSTRVVVFSKAPGTSGIVRNIAWIASATDAAFNAVLPGCTLEVKYDGAAGATISIPLFTLGAMEYPRSVIHGASVSTPAFELGCGPYNDNPAFAGAALGSCGNFRLPMPFTNGIEISVVAPANTDLQSVFFNVLYEDALGTAWNRNLRLCADRSSETVPAGSTIPFAFKLTDATHLLVTSGTLPANIAGRVIVADTFSVHDMLVLTRTDATHAIVSSLDTDGAPINTINGAGFHAAVHRFLDRPAGEVGYIALVVGGYANPSADIDILDEGNVRFWIDQTNVATREPDLEWTSIEDFATCCFNYEQQSWGEEGGIVSRDVVTNYEKSIYRCFYRTPIGYTNGVRGIVPQYSTIGSSDYRWTTFYYKFN